jgi:23S rRNA G2445 N2-methylase RlmL
MNLPFSDDSFDALCADLPFGQLVGSHEENQWLYPAILAEASRVARSKARFVVVTHEVRLMDTTLENLNTWKLVNKQMITLSGLHPRIYILERE